MVEFIPIGLMVILYVIITTQEIFQKCLSPPTSGIRAQVVRYLGFLPSEDRVSHTQEVVSSE